jgi:hypothetical protein
VAVLRALYAFSAAAVVAASLNPVVVSAQTLTQDEALELAFPGADFVRRTAYLDDETLDSAGRLAGPDVPIESTVVTYYVAQRAGEAVGVAYFDVHRVRTLPEVMMVVVGRDDRILRLESVSFHEPPEYRAPAGWLRQFSDGGLDEDLSLKGEIANITGATLTAGAASRAVRRSLALHEVIDPLGEGRE